MTDLYFVRHGQASFGAADYDRLSELGIRQSRLLADYFMDMEAYFPIVFAGTNRRQRETAEIIASRLRESDVSAGLRVLPELDEFDAAQFLRACKNDMMQDDPSFIAELGASFSDGRIFQKTFVHILRWSFCPKCRHARAENFKSFQERVKKGVKTVIAESKTCKKAAVVTSGGVLALVMQMAFGFSDQEALNWVWRFYNASVTVFSVDHDRLELKVDNSVVHFTLAGDPNLITNL